MTARAVRSLHDGWSVRAAGGPVPDAVAGRSVAATVPGCVHTDLLAAGLVPDPYLDDHEHLVAWIGRCDWEYRTTFAWSPDGHERHDLVLHGLDTVAVVTLNGRELARTANQHRTYRLDARPALVDGVNELVVTFESPVRYADRQSLELGYRPHTMHHPYNAMRKSACNFGWDWGPDLATVGIWRPVELHVWSGVRLASVRPLTTIDGDTGRLSAHLDLEYADVPPGGGGPVGVEVAVGEVAAVAEVPAGAPSAVVEVEVPDVRLWWPRGYGEQPLYPVDVEVTTGGAAADAVADRWSGRVGFRTVRLHIEPDEHGTSFGFVVNDQPVAARGANWIPDDVFVHRVDRARYARRLDQADLANLNLLRVWGGGVYEADDFYDLCDERGILVWQDFLFACAAYAEEEPLAGEVEAEVRDNVVRLLPHPSLVLWNGNNENLWGFEDWDWRPRLEGRSWGLGYYTGLLPRLVAELDPHRPYTPGSPFSPLVADGGEPAAHPNDPRHATVHMWDQWNRVDYATYRDTEPRFVAEFGWQGPPAWSTLRRAISDDPLTPESPGMIAHQKAANGNDKLTDGLVPHLPLPGDVEDWHWAMSLNQAVAVRVAVEHFRSLGPRCTGSIVWQLNDCWPVTSWAAVDGDGRAKPLLYALRQAHADRLVTVQPRGGGLVAVVVNDSPSAWDGELSLRRLGYDGGSLASSSLPVAVRPRSSVELPVPGAVAGAGDEAAELVVGSVGDVRGLWFFADYRDSRLAAPRLRATAEAADDGYRVHVTADALVRDLAVLADKVHPDAVVDEMLVTLLPGEQVTFQVSAPPGLDPAAFTDPRVLRSANDLLA